MAKRFKASRAAKFVLMFVVVLVAACNPAEDVEPAKEVRIDETNNGGQVQLAVGEVLVVRLESNPSTGFGWEINELDETKLQQIGGALFESSVKENPPPGTGGWATFRFEAVAEGESELRLIYHQPWTEQEPLVVYTVQVVVQ